MLDRTYQQILGMLAYHEAVRKRGASQTRVDYLVTAEHSKQCSLFEFTVAPGFNTGAHYHTKIEEIFYVLEGELDLRCDERTIGVARELACSCLPAQRMRSETLDQRPAECS